ncbi:MAG TPA: hypothetical protein VF469_09920 [Kofleriaceae bacterium]
MKPTPVRPPDQPGVVTDGSLPEKPSASQRIAAAAVVPWTVSLVASTPSPWATMYTTLTATVSMDIGPTPYFLRIRDNETGAYLASCGSGTTCAVAVTRSNVDAVSFTAMVTDVQNPPVASASTTIHWHSAGVKLAASATTVPVGGASTITAITDYDIASSPFYTELYDDTTATFLQSCGAGTTCSVSVSQTAATTHRYRACFSAFGTSYPPPNILECTAVKYVTWSNSGAAVSLTVSSGTVTATSSIDVGTTPYYLQIYDLTGSRIASCGTGTTCTTSFTAAWGGSYLLALIGPSSLTPNFTAVAASTVRGYFDLGNGGQGTPIGPGPHPAGPVGDPSFIANIVTGPAIQ